MKVVVVVRGNDDGCEGGGDEERGTCNARSDREVEEQDEENQE